MCRFTRDLSGNRNGIHERLIYLRKRKKFTTEVVAARISVDKSTVSHWESAAYWADLKYSIEKRLLLLQLAELYWVDYVWLVRGHCKRTINALVIDDQSTSRTISSLLLKQILGDKLAVHEFSRAEAALVWADSHYADFILCDYNLPGEDTQVFIWTLHEQADYQTTPIMVLTADNSETTRKTCLDAGAQAVIRKPLKMDTLVPLCQHYLPHVFAACA